MIRTCVKRTPLQAIAGLLVIPFVLQPDIVSRQAEPVSMLTVPEKTGYRQTSRYEDVMSFLAAVDKASPQVHLTTFGVTNEERRLPLAVVGASDASPEAVKRTEKLRVYIQANIHGGEVEGKESALMLLRELAAGEHDDWLGTIVFLIAPIYNADGNERIALDNRGPQHGPEGGQGQRPNAQNLDLNRDHMKLDSPEARAVVKLLNDYDPHVSFDLHTTNGTRHAYRLTYSPPLHPATDRGIVELLRNDWFPQVTRTIKDKYGWDYFYYGNVAGGPGGSSSGTRRWETFDHRPRFNNNYIGLRNRFALLSEAYAYLTFRDRILATSRFLDEGLTFASRNAGRIRTLTLAADSARLAGARLPLRAELQHTGPVEVLMGEVSEERHPVDGHVMHLRKETVRPERMADYTTFKGIDAERVPSAYYLPPTLTAVIEKLRAHGIATIPTSDAASMAVEVFRIDGNETAAVPFQNHHERTLQGAWIASDRLLPAGTMRVDLSQPLGRLAFYLIEPRSDDGLVNWNVLDEALKGATVYPIVRSRD
jgi:hypothetical protein